MTRKQANISGAVGHVSTAVPAWTAAKGWQLADRRVAVYAGEQELDVAYWAAELRDSLEAMRRREAERLRIDYRPLDRPTAKRPSAAPRSVAPVTRVREAVAVSTAAGTCPRCGRADFRKSGAGLAWHVANNLGCARLATRATGRAA